MIMKHISIVLLAGLAAVAFACTKETTPEQTAPEPQEMGVGGDIVCIDGTLHFPSVDCCFATMRSLVDEDALAAFEQEHNFHSIRSLTESMLDEMIACETPEEYAATLESCKGYLVEDGDRLMPVISAVGYASVANQDGVFYIGDTKHTVIGDKIAIETTDPTTRAAVVEEYDYVCAVSSDEKTRGRTEQKYTDNRYQSGKFKVFARTNVIRYTASETINGQNRITSNFICQVHVSGQKNKTFGGWNTYKDHFYVENLHFEIKVGWITFWHNDYRNTSFYQSNGRVKNFYVEEPIGTEKFFGPEAIIMPTSFKCIVHRARSGSIGNCGVLTHSLDFQTCKSYKGVMVQACR